MSQRNDSISFSLTPLPGQMFNHGICNNNNSSGSLGRFFSLVEKTDTAAVNYAYALRRQSEPAGGSGSLTIEQSTPAQ